MLTLCITRLIFVQSSTRSLSFVLFLLSFLVSGCDSKEEPQAQAIVIDSSLCDFSKGSCIQQLEGVDISLKVTPDNTPSETPLEVLIKSNKPLKIISARLEGRDMFMGVIPLKLIEVSKTLYKGALIYGSCSSGYMVWRLFVTIELPAGDHQTITFDFLADS